MSIIRRKNYILIFLFLFIAIVVYIIGHNNSSIFLTGLNSVNSQIEKSIGPASSIYQSYDSYDQADKWSDIVVIGAVTKAYPPQEIKIGETQNTLTGETVPLTGFYIVSDIKVDKVMKGNYKSGDIIKIMQSSGSQSDSNMDMSSYYKVNKKYLFFLADFHNSKIKTPFEAINPEQGSIPITNNKVDKFNVKQLIKDGVTEDKLVADMKIKLNQLNKKYGTSIDL